MNPRASRILNRQRVLVRVREQQLDAREEGQLTAALVVVACGVAAFATLVIAAVTRACQ